MTPSATVTDAETPVRPTADLFADVLRLMHGEGHGVMPLRRTSYAMARVTCRATRSALPPPRDAEQGLLMHHIAEEGPAPCGGSLFARAARLHASKCPSWHAVSAAAEHGHVDVLQELVTDPDDWHFDSVWNEGASGGHVSVLQWALDAGIPNGYPLFTDIKAASSGSLSVLKWLHARGMLKNGNLLLETAVQEGHMHVAEWLCSLEDVHYEVDDGCMEAAAASGRLELMELLHDKHGPFPEADVYAEVIGSVETVKIPLLEWLHRKGYRPRRAHFTKAVRCRDTQVARWLHARGCPFNRADSSIAAELGDVTTLRWMWEFGNDFLFDEDTFLAAFNYKSESVKCVVKFLHSVDCFWTEEVLEEAKRFADRTGDPTALHLFPCPDEAHIGRHV
jgi:hypothetical protein